MSEELKPCPFCGTSLEVKWFNFSPAGFGAECKSPCSFGVYGFDTKNECIKFVNTRPIEDRLRAELGELREDICNYQAELARRDEQLHDEMSQLEIATDLGNKRWVALNEIYENAEKHNANWCKRKAQEGLGIR